MKGQAKNNSEFVTKFVGIIVKLQLFSYEMYLKKLVKSFTT